MKITVVGMIKNAADVIETYIRANGLYADNFVLIDNNSTDNTVNILKNLIKEGYQIELFKDDENAYMQSMKMNILINNVANRHSSDWIIPLDDDEILVSKNGKSVRDVIESWDKNKGYYANWRIYIPTEEDDNKIICPAKRQTFCFSDDLVKEGKIIFGNDIALDKNFRIVQGNHCFVGVDNEKVKQEELIIAHYPVRSEAQIISKALVGWTNYIAMPERLKGNGDHWKAIYDYYKRNSSISIDAMWEICMMYLYNKDLSIENVILEREILNIDSRAYIIKYTKEKEVDPFLNYMLNTEKLAENYANLLKKEF